MRRALGLSIVAALTLCGSSSEARKRIAILDSGSIQYLPAVSSNPIFVGGTYSLVRGYSGPLFRVVRSTDSATLDIYPDPNTGGPNLGPFNAWAAGTITVDKRYNQLANGFDDTQTTAAQRPNFVPSAARFGIYGITFPHNTSNLNLVRSASLTGSGQATTLFEVGFCNSSNADGSLSGADISQLGATFNGAGSLSFELGRTSTSSPMLQKATTTSPVAATIPGRSQTQVISLIANGATNSIFHADERTATVAANSAGTWTGGVLGKLITSTLYFWGESYASVIYPATLSTADEQTVRRFLQSRFNVQTNGNAQLVILGNSIEAGVGSTNNINLTRQTEPYLKRPIYILDTGTGGKTVAQFSTQTAIFTPLKRNDVATNLMQVPEATNDINGAASGSIVGVGTTAWNTNATFITAMQTAGFTVIVPTILPRNWTGSGTDQSQKETERLTYNGLVASNAAGMGFTVVDYAAIPNMSNPSNTTYYADGTHPTSTGYGLMGQTLAAAVNGLLP